MSAVVGLVLAAAGFASEAAFPIPSALPPHSWENVGAKLFIHGCKADGLFNASELALASKFSLMTVEKGQGLTMPGFADDKAAAIARQWKAARRASRLPEGWALFYLNAKLDWAFFELHAQMEAHASWPVQRSGASAGEPCRSHGDPTFPQPPEGMLVFNHSKKTVREAFVNACVNATEHGFDGCFIDSAGFARGPPYPGATSGGQERLAAQCNTSLANVQALGKGTAALLTELQQVVGDDKLIVAKEARIRSAAARRALSTPFSPWTRSAAATAVTGPVATARPSAARRMHTSARRRSWRP